MTSRTTVPGHDNSDYRYDLSHPRGPIHIVVHGEGNAMCGKPVGGVSIVMGALVCEDCVIESLERQLVELKRKRRQR